MSNKGLASRIRVEAERRGIDASPDHVSVKRWLDGTRPHDDTIRCIAAVLSAKLGREVSFAEIGYEVKPQRSQNDVVEDSARYPAESARAVELLDTLTSADIADSPEVMRSSWVSGDGPQRHHGLPVFIADMARRPGLTDYCERCRSREGSGIHAAPNGP